MHTLLTPHTACTAQGELHKLIDSVLDHAFGSRWENDRENKELWENTHARIDILNLKNNKLAK